MSSLTMTELTWWALAFFVGGIYMFVVLHIPSTGVFDEEGGKGMERGSENAIRALSIGRKRGIINRPSEIQDLSCAVLCRVVVNQNLWIYSCIPILCRVYVFVPGVCMSPM